MKAERGHNSAHATDGARPGPKRRGRWRRRLVWLFALLIAGRIALGFALEPIVRKVAAGFGVDLSWERLDLSLHSGRVELWHLAALVSQDDEASLGLLEADTIAVDVDLLALLRGVLRVRRLEVDGVRIELVRAADGAWNFDPILAQFAPDPSRPKPPPKPHEPYEPTPIPLRLPIQIVAARAQDVEFTLRDDSGADLNFASAHLSIVAANVGVPDRDGRLQVVVTSPQLLDVLRVRAHVVSTEEAVLLDLSVRLSRLRLGPLESVLAGLGIEPMAERLDAHLRLDARVAHSSEDQQRLEVEFRIEEAFVKHDGVEALALDSLEVDITELWPRGLLIREVAVTGLRGAAERLVDGGFAVAGIALRGTGASSQPGAHAIEEDAQAPRAIEVADVALEPFQFGLESVRVSEGRLDFIDRTLNPPLDVSALLDAIDAGPFNAGHADDAGEGANLLLQARVPGVLETLSLTGSVRSLTPFPDLALAIEATGVVPDRVAPYMAMVGLEPTFEDGSFRIEAVELNNRAVDGAPATGISLHVNGIALQDEGVDLGSIDSVELEFPSGAPFELRVAGISATAKRYPGNRFELLGIRIGGSPTRPKRALAPTSDTTESPPTEGADAQVAQSAFALPSIWLPNIDIGVHRFVLIDETSDGLSEFGIGPFECVVRPATPSVPGARRYRLDLDGTTRLARDFSASIDLEQSASGRLEVKAETAMLGTNLERLDPWISLLGVESSLADGTIQATLAVSIDAVDGRPRIDLTAGPVAITEVAAGAEQEWLGLDELRVENLVFADGIGVDLVRVVGPRLRLERDEEGGLRALGLRLPPAAPGAAGVLVQTPPALPAETEPVASVPLVDESNVATRGPAAGLLRIGRLELEGAAFTVDDRVSGESHVVRFGADVEILDLVPGVGAPSTTIDGTLRIGDSTLAAQGEVVPDPLDLRASILVSGERLEGAFAAPYLPPGVQTDLIDGVFSAQLSARLAAVAEGGHSVSLTIEDVELRERGAERPLLSVPSVRVEAPRLDVAAQVFEIDEISVTGVTVEVSRTLDHGLSLCGVRWSPLEPVAGEEQAGEAAVDPLAGRGGRVGAGTDAPPHIQLGRMEFELAELRVTSDAFEDRPALVLTSRLSLREPYALVIAPDEDAASEDAQSIGLDLLATASPGSGTLQVGLDFSPFVGEPSVSARVAVEGISGESLIALAPEIAQQIDASGIVDGTFTAVLDAELNWRRRGLFDFNLSDGFSMDLTVSDVALRPTPEADIALGVDRVEVTARRITPRTRRLHLSRIEVVRPHARARRTPEGFEIAGLVFLAAQEAAQEAAQLEAPAAPAASEPQGGDSSASGDEQAESVAAGEGATVAAEPGAAMGAALARPPRKGEVRIDTILVRDVDFIFEDTRADPPFLVPLDSLDFEVRGLTTRALTEPIPVRFSMTMGAGDVPLPVRLEKRSLLRGVATGVVSGVSSVVGASSAEEIVYEQRPLFQEVSTSGRLVLVPKPSGWVRASISGFELVGLRGLARQSGVDIGDGVLESDVRVRLSEQKGGHVESVSSFSHLALSEPDGGPISRYLKLPAPLDTVLFVLKNEQGEHRIPLSFDFGQDGGISTGEITRKASAAFLGIVTDALTGAPMRAVGTVTDVVGLGGVFGARDNKPRLAGMVAVAEFAAGGTQVSVADREQIDEVMQAMKDDKLLVVDGTHAFGADDISRAERLASPGSDQARRLVGSLRQRRRELTRARDELALAARSQLLLGQNDAFDDTRQRLIAADRDLGTLESAIDRVAALLRPGAEQRRDRRTREAALAVANTRLDAIKLMFLDANITPDRFNLRSPRYELPDVDVTDPRPGSITLVTKGGTPPKSFFRRILGWVGL